MKPINYSDCISCGIILGNIAQYFPAPSINGTYSELTQDLCFLYKNIENDTPIIKIDDLPDEMKNWWENHKKEDLKREQPNTKYS